MFFNTLSCSSENLSNNKQGAPEKMVITQFSQFYKVSCRLCLSFMETFRNILVKFIDVQIGMDRFNLKKNDRFVMKTTTKKRKTKRSFTKTIVFKKIVVPLTIVNDKPSVTIVNEGSLTTSLH